MFLCAFAAKPTYEDMISLYTKQGIKIRFDRLNPLAKEGRVYSPDDDTWYYINEHPLLESTTHT